MTRLTWPRINEASPLGFLLLSSFLVRLALIPFFYDGFNAWAYAVFGSFLLGGRDPYLVVAQDPTLLNINPWRYPPLYLLFTIPALIAKVATGQTLLYLAILKIPLAICDVVSTLFFFKILATRFSKSIALKGAAIFTFNPATVFVTVVAGFSDPVAVMFTLMAFYYFLGYKRGGSESSSPELYKSALFLGLGIVAKIYPLFLVPIFMRDSTNWRDRMMFLAVAAVPVLLFSLPFLFSDPLNYLYMLTAKNAGGEHPLFGAFSLPLYGELVLFGILFVALAWIYVAPLQIQSRLVLTFLWINLATLSSAFQYLTWGIPFFILLLYLSKSVPRTLPWYPIISVLSAFVFNGSYDIFMGSTGPYYWMLHILQERVVVFRAYPIIGTIAATATPISILVTVYYLFRIGSAGRFEDIWARLPDLRFLARLRLPKIPDVRHMILTILLLALVVLAWTYVINHSTFENFSNPTLKANTFTTSFQFQSSTLDYQLVFAGNGTYAISQESGQLVLSRSQLNSSSYLYRGWLKIEDGFRMSSSSLISFNFKVDNFPVNATSMEIANFTNGSFFITRTGTRTSFDFFDSISNTVGTLSSGDNQWHSFAIIYTSQNATVSLDNHTLVLPPAIFTRAILGNQYDRLPFGQVEYSNLQASTQDFPGGTSTPYFALLSLAGPLALTVLTFGVVPGGFLRSRPRCQSQLLQSKRN